MASQSLWHVIKGLEAKARCVLLCPGLSLTYNVQVPHLWSEMPMPSPLASSLHDPSALLRRETKINGTSTYIKVAACLLPSAHLTRISGHDRTLHRAEHVYQGVAGHAMLNEISSSYGYHFSSRNQMHSMLLLEAVVHVVSLRPAQRMSFCIAKLLLASRTSSHQKSVQLTIHTRPS